MAREVAQLPAGGAEEVTEGNPEVRVGAMQLHGGGGDGGGAFGVGQQRAGDEEERVQVCNWKRRRSMTAY